MNNKKYIVPVGMLDAAVNVLPETMRVSLSSDSRWPGMRTCLEAALKWLAENPSVPTLEQSSYMYDGFNGAHDTAIQYCMVEWQRRMFLAPKLNIPTEIKDLIVDTFFGISSSKRDAEILNERVVEAYRRGQKSREEAK